MAALARTMIDIDPNHPITKHISVAYWKGGDELVEREIYRAANIEKICAWGGFASVKHITKYIQPGIDLITLDPKKQHDTHWSRSVGRRCNNACYSLPV